jgi:OHCU decarboxylase
MPDSPTLSRLVPIDQLNRLDQIRFTAALRPLFEAADPLARALLPHRPFRDYDDLLARAGQVIEQLSEAEQVAVVNAHPRIGMPAAALRALSEISYREQGYDREGDHETVSVADLDRLARSLATLNDAYETKFGFRFVVFVNRRPRSVIADLMEQRLRNLREQELATALSEMLAIARDRLTTLSRL